MPVAPMHIGDLVRIADCGGDTARQDTAVKLVRGDERTLDVEMRVDEAGTTIRPEMSISSMPE
jgi:hypothetical protein